MTNNAKDTKSIKTQVADKEEQGIFFCVLQSIYGVMLTCWGIVFTLPSLLAFYEIMQEQILSLYNHGTLKPVFTIIHELLYIEALSCFGICMGLFLLNLKK